MPATLSVIVITHNERDNILGCLQSVAFADEWVVVDSSSTDGTREIAQGFGARVVNTTDWPGFGPQKNRALAEASGRWVAAMRAACRAGRSAAKASWKRAGLTANSTAVSAPCPVGYWSGTRAALRTLSFEVLATSPSRSPSSGAKAAT